MRPISKKRSAALKEYAKAKKEFVAKFAKPGGKSVICWNCIRSVPIAKITIHHTRGRIGSLLCDTRYFSLLCVSCHNWVGEHPNEAREKGLLCAKGLWNTPDRS